MLNRAEEIVKWKFCHVDFIFPTVVAQESFYSIEGPFKQNIDNYFGVFFVGYI